MNSAVLFAIEICTFCMWLGAEGAPTYTTTPLAITMPDDAVGQTPKYICDFDRWEQFKIDFDRTFANDEDEFKHLVIFCDNLRKIQFHNELYREKKIGFKMGLNQFSDMTNLEFKEKVLGAKN